VTNDVTYRTKNLTGWNENRRGEIELDAPARVYLGDSEITDRDCIAFALRELRKRGYDVEARVRRWIRRASDKTRRWRRGRGEQRERDEQRGPSSKSHHRLPSSAFLNASHAARCVASTYRFPMCRPPRRIPLR
jgi:hypothetical protein